MAILSAGVFFLSAGILPAQTPIDEARKIIEQVDEVAGTYGRAQKDEGAKKPVIEKLEKAISLLSEEKKKKNDDYDATFFLARAYAMEYNLDIPGTLEKTVQYSEEAIRLAPAKQEPCLFLAIFYTNSGHPSEAIEQYLKALWLEGKKRNPILLGGLAAAYSFAGNGLWAYCAAKQQLENFPQDPAAKAIFEMSKSLAGKNLIDSVEITFSPGGVIYKNKALKYSFEIPPGWRVAREGRDGENASMTEEVIILGLPKVKTEGGEEVENALGVMVFRKKDKKEARTFAKNYLADIKGKLEILEEGKDWLVFQSPSGEKVFKGRMEGITSGKFAYILNFTATKETYDLNIGRFNKWKGNFKTNSK